ncbi:hypothetical protein GCM10010435_02660 [Winogradskya consettensis]|uniref:MFS transporter n=1 Tax=Winogradskya consettensis TaxID=113560 RepID=A0A919VK14_9ACTN|nr:MFS transporter [Actinoplanes consettensis]GIM66064.1 hypothetical protein Aco04nite_00290 [Actinoplanes consettensis]
MTTVETLRPRGLSPVMQAGIAQGVLGFGITGLGACLVLLAGDLGVAPESLAWLPATFGFGLLATAPAGPYLLRHGPRPALVAGSLALAAGLTLLGLSSAMPLVVAGALLLGVGGAAFVLVTPALLTGAGATSQLSRATAAGSAAAVLAPALIGGVDATGLVNGRVALLAGVPLLLFLALTARPAAPVGSSPIERPALSVAGRRWTVMVLAVSVEFCFTIWAVARLAGTGLPVSRAALLGTAFPIGMALGRAAAPLLLGVLPMRRGGVTIPLTGVVPLASAVTAVGAVLVVASGDPAVVTAGLVVAGLGVATLYPVTLATLVATPGLSGRHAASLGALASGTAIVAAPAALARLADVLDLRLAYLIILPTLAALLLLRRRD